MLSADNLNSVAVHLSYILEFYIKASYSRSRLFLRGRKMIRLYIHAKIIIDNTTLVIHYEYSYEINYEEPPTPIITMSIKRIGAI